MYKVSLRSARILNWYVRFVDVTVEAASTEDAKRRVFDEMPDLETTMWTVIDVIRLGG